MDLKDKNLLGLQFRNQIYKRDGSEFQSFFEDIAEKAYPDFQRVKPYGRNGDEGNDGYRPTEGIYYQIYSPTFPNEKEASAAKKMKNDFEKLKKSGWDKISEIKEYHFVYNDKGRGISIELEGALSELRQKNPNIKFSIITSNKLEIIFFTLKNDQLMALGFDIDSTKAIQVAQEFLEKIDIALDGECANFGLNSLNSVNEIISKLNNEDLLIEQKILEARSLKMLERIKEARKIYENLCICYPNDPRAYLYLAEIYLSIEDFEKNLELLTIAEKINNSFWLFKLEKLMREYCLGVKYSSTDIDENSFPTVPRIKSYFYRLYGLFLERSEDFLAAESFIERAIFLNPKKMSNYEAKLFILERKIFNQAKEKEIPQKDLAIFISEIKSIENKMEECQELSPRSRISLNFIKINVNRISDNFYEIEELAQNSIDLIMKCYYDPWIEKLLTNVLMFMKPPIDVFNLLLEHLQNSEKKISNEFSKVLLFQFILNNNLFSEGRVFFDKIKFFEVLEFIDSLKNEKFNDAYEFLKNDIWFSVAFANYGKDFPELRRLIINNLPNDNTIQKDKLLILLNYDENNMEEAFEIIKNIDLSKLDYFECKPILKIAQTKKAWDFVVLILKKLLQYEKNKDTILKLKLQLFTAYQNLEKLLELIQIGTNILSNDNELNLLDEQNREALLAQTLISQMKRGELEEAIGILEKHKKLLKSFESKIWIEAEIYIKSKNALKSLNSIVEVICSIKAPTPEQYGILLKFFIEIENLMDFRMISLEKVEFNCFVKLKEYERWYFVGDGEGLDASIISSSDKKFAKFINKKVGEILEFENKYRLEGKNDIIENILPIEKYIYWQCMHHVKKLTNENRWNMVEIIDIPTIGNTINTQYIEARLEDERVKHGNFFELYCNNNYPLAFLAVSEGGLSNALGRIIKEERGFVNFSSGDSSELEQQKDVARRMIAGESFYIDGTSALVLSEAGILSNIFQYLPNLKIPQSVITLLFEIKEKFRYIAGQVGHLGYIQGKLAITTVDLKKRQTIQNHFSNCITLMEAKPENVKAISAANKIDCFCEQKVPGYLCDSCILAQRENTLIMTEDFLYLRANEIQTQKRHPLYCSSFAIMRVLFETKKISFEEYLNYFSYLSSYRFRFLPLTSEDLAMAAFGDRSISIVHPAKIRLLNLSLTLSEEFGVSFDSAFSVVVHFIIRILIDDAILPELVERIFFEILDSFPTKNDKRFIGKMILIFIQQHINSLDQRFLNKKSINEKMNVLSNFLEIYSPKNHFKILI